MAALNNSMEAKYYSEGELYDKSFVGIDRNLWNWFCSF